jgi:hypothetical protein
MSHFIPPRLMAAPALLAALALATTTTAQPNAVPPLTMTPGRLGGSMAALVGLIGVVLGAVALARARRTGKVLRGGTVALLAGLVAIALGALVVATAGGGLGTGHGFGGGIAALVLGSISAILGGLARARSRSTV